MQAAVSASTPAPDPVAGLFPARTYHHIVGSTGAGKTTWWFQTLADWLTGADVLGCRSTPCPWAYVCCDHSLEETTRTVERIGVPSLLPHIYSAIDCRFPDEFGAVLTFAKARVPGLRLLVIDAIAALVREGRINDYGVVKDFVRGLRRAAVQNDLTIIGIGQDAKGDGSSFVPYRQRPAGSHAWGAYCSTIIVIERADAQNLADRRRKIIIEPRNAPADQFEFELDDRGRFVPVGDLGWFLLDQEFRKLPPAVDLYRRTVLDWATKAGLSERSAERWIEEKVKTGWLERSGRGIYRKRRLS